MVDALPKPIASLSAGLLARKGLARKPVLALAEGEAPVPLTERATLGEMAGVSDVLAEQLGRTARATKDRAAFTLRLDADRRLRLRLAAALTGRSAQQLVTEAIDTMLGEMAELEPLARRVAALEGRG
jgi:predicted DNA-binding protein